MGDLDEIGRVEIPIWYILYCRGLAIDIGMMCDFLDFVFIFGFVGTIC